MAFSFKFLPVKDLFFSVIPTIGTYIGYVEEISPKFLPNKIIAIGIGLAASIVLAIVFYKQNVKAYKKSLSEILATGYFMNFTGRLGQLMKSKESIQFTFPDDSKQEFYTNNINIEIGIPNSLKSLVAYSEKIEEDSEILLINETDRSDPYWVRGIAASEKLTIHEYPRTLFALPSYLKDELSNFKISERKSKRLFDHFNDKIEELRIEHSNQIPASRMNFKRV